MRRIEDVFKRITGAAAEQRPMPALERYASEPKVEENKVSTFIAPGPYAVDPKPVVRQKPPVVPAAAETAPLPTFQHTHQSDGGSDPGSDVSNEKLIDVRKIFDYVGFLGRSLQRRAPLAIGAFALAFGLTIASAA